MSLSGFPAISQGGRTYCLQELSGRLINGNKEDFEDASKSEILRDYPRIDRCHLQMLQHCISRENVHKSVFSENHSTNLQQAAEIWRRRGVLGFMDFLASMSDKSRFALPITLTNEAVKKLHHVFRNTISSSSEDLFDTISKTSTTLNWFSNWIRYIAFQPDGHKIALCQPNDYIRVYTIGKTSRAPITLRHPRQRNVASMAWKPYDQFVIAVCCEDAVLIWRLGSRNLSTRPSAQCAQILELPSGFSPPTQCFWDSAFSSILFVISPAASRILMLDTASAEVAMFGSWFGSSVTRMWPSSDGTKLLIAYRSNFIRIYDRDSWREEKWDDLHGCCVAAAWAHDSSYLLFSTSEESVIRAIRFNKKSVATSEGHSVMQSFGSESAISVFDISEISCGSLDIDSTEKVGGIARTFAISPDAQRLAVTFQNSKSVVALFLVDWCSTVVLTPCGFVQAPGFGDAAIVQFFPTCSFGSLLCIVWSGGRLQYMPLIYGRAIDQTSHSRRLLSHPLEDTFEDYHADDDSLIIRHIPETETVEREGRLNMSDTPELFSSSGILDQVLSRPLTDRSITVD